MFITNGYDYSASKRSTWLKLLYLAATKREILSRISIWVQIKAVKSQCFTAFCCDLGFENMLKPQISQITRIRKDRRFEI